MKGFQFLVISGICLGTTGFIVKLIGPDVSAYLLASIRILAAAALIFIFLASERRTKLLELKDGDLHIFLIAGLFGIVFGFGFYVKSLTFIPVANAVFLLFIYPIATAVLAKVFLDEPLGKYSILALLLSFIGIFVVFGQGFDIVASSEGSMYALLAGVGYSVFIVTMRYMEKKGHSFWDVVFWPMLLGGLMLLPLNLTDQIVFLPFADTILLIGALIFFPTFLAYLFYAEGLKTISAKKAALIETLVEPAATVFFAWLVLGEVVPQYIFIGGFLIILANLIVRYDLAEKEPHRKRI
jgi:drug/metabolite transporter (DMT)-like permease